MAELGNGYKPLIRSHYPHMMVEDTVVWTKFLEVWAKDVSELWYDVHVGTPMSLPGGEDGRLQKVADGVSKKRIDVVCRVKAGFWVVEVKPYANMYALGQVLSYRKLFIEEYNVALETTPVIVASGCDPDLANQVDDFGVLVIVT